MKSRLIAGLFAAIVIVYATLAGVSIWRSATVFEGHRYFALSDDPMISMRYAKNLIAGHGPVWNAGEPPVEGYTNPGWMLVMAAVQAFPLSPWNVSLVIQVIEVILLVANLFAIRRLAIACGADAPGAVAAVFLTAAFWPLTGWSLAGFETAVLALLFTAALTRAIETYGRQEFSTTPCWILGAATLFRLDAAVVAAAMLVVLVVADPSSRSKHLVIGSLIVIGFLALQTAWRVAYYGEWLPNTYYLKMTGYPVLWRIAWGTYSLLSFGWYGRWWLLAFAIFALGRRSAGAILLAAVVALQFAYSAYAGGSDTRLTIPVMPLLLTLCAVGLRELAVRVARAIGRDHAPSPRRWQAWGFAAVVVVIAAGISGVSFVDFGAPSDDLTPLILRVRTLEDITTPAASVAVVAAGGLPFFLDRPAIDLLGKNDAVIAREPAHRPFNTFRTRYVSGHVKWDYAYSIGTLHPDVIADLWGNADEARPYLAAYRTVVIGDRVTYLRSDSSRVRWDRVAGLQ